MISSFKLTRVDQKLIILGDGHEGWSEYVEPLVIVMILVFNAVVAIWCDS